MDLSVVLSVLASFFALCVFVYYNYDILKGKGGTKPNPLSWLLWLLVTAINSITFFSMNWDWVKGLTIFTDALCVFFTTTIILCSKELRGEFKWKSVWEKRAVVVGLLSVVAWGTFRSSTIGNIVLQIAYTMAFIPMYLGLLENPRRERSRVWFAFTFSFGFAFAAAALRWEGRWENLFSPSLYVILHALTGALASRKLKKPETT